MVKCHPWMSWANSGGVKFIKCTASLPANDSTLQQIQYYNSIINLLYLIQLSEVNSANQEFRLGFKQTPLHKDLHSLRSSHPCGFALSTPSMKVWVIFDISYLPNLLIHVWHIECLKETMVEQHSCTCREPDPWDRVRRHTKGEARGGWANKCHVNVQCNTGLTHGCRKGRWLKEAVPPPPSWGHWQWCSQADAEYKWAVKAGKQDPCPLPEKHPLLYLSRRASLAPLRKSLSTAS